MFTAKFEQVLHRGHSVPVYRGIIISYLSSDKNDWVVEWVGENPNVAKLKQAMKNAGYTKANTTFEKIPKL